MRLSSRLARFVCQAVGSSAARQPRCGSHRHRSMLPVLRVARPCAGKEGCSAHQRLADVHSSHVACRQVVPSTAAQGQRQCVGNAVEVGGGARGAAANRKELRVGFLHTRQAAVSRLSMCALLRQHNTTHALWRLSLVGHSAGGLQQRCISSWQQRHSMRHVQLHQLSVPSQCAAWPLGWAAC